MPGEISLPQPSRPVLQAGPSNLLFLVSLALPALLHAGDGPKVQGCYPDRMNWWLEARFGMFIHWDMSSVAGIDTQRATSDPIAPRNGPVSSRNGPVGSRNEPIGLRNEPVGSSISTFKVRR